MPDVRVPKTITILAKEYSYTVIADGLIEESLCWDEMLGHVARMTLTQKVHGQRIGEERNWFSPIRGLLKEKF